jgi:hypothetical protein
MLKAAGAGLAVVLDIRAHSALSAHEARAMLHALTAIQVHVAASISEIAVTSYADVAFAAVTAAKATIAKYGPLPIAAMFTGITTATTAFGASVAQRAHFIFVGAVFTGLTRRASAIVIAVQTVAASVMHRFNSVAAISGEHLCRCWHYKPLSCLVVYRYLRSSG